MCMEQIQNILKIERYKGAHSKALLKFKEAENRMWVRSNAQAAAEGYNTNNFKSISR